MTRRRFLVPCLVLLYVMGAAAALADGRPPTRVGRVALVDGAVAVRAMGGEWSDATVNDPIAVGMAVRTGPSGRAILRVGALTLALAPASELQFAVLDRKNTDFALRQGRLGVALSPLDPAPDTEIDIARGAIWLVTPGVFDIAAGDEHVPARITAFAGSARVVGKGLDAVIAGGSATSLSGSDPVAASLGAAATDDFVAWWRPQAGDDADSATLAYVAPEMTGYETLDANGRWVPLDGYGPVWFPTNVPDNWAPYRDGHWRWIAPWGWTWIDDLPWGFATSHYGRWSRFRGTDPQTARWGWVPGRRATAPAYAPALVAFLGTAGVGLSYPDASGPAVGWFPLAPGEIYWPSYAADRDALRRLNEDADSDPATIAAATNGAPPANIVNGKYRNRRFASVVPRPIFVAGRPVAPALVQLPRQRLENAPLLAGSPQIAPPATHPVAVAAAPAGEHRQRIESRLAHAVHTLARVLRPRVATVARRGIVGPRTRLALAGHWRAPGRLVRPRAVTAAAPRSARLRLAAAHRRAGR